MFPLIFRPVSYVFPRVAARTAAGECFAQLWRTFAHSAHSDSSEPRSFQLVDVQHQSLDNGVLKRIVLNNPQRRNALSLKMMQELINAISESGEHELILVSAEGPVFSSGHDLSELKSGTERKRHEDIFHTCTKLMCLIEDFPFPIIAQVNGLAAAAGCQLIASCDIVLASTKSRFSTPGVNNGLFCSTPGIPIVRSVPLKTASKLLFTGDPITAEEALRCGLITDAVEENRLEEETLRIANRILEKSPSVIAVGKKFLGQQRQMSRDQAYQAGEKVMVENLQMRDGQEGIQAFLEKRKPMWEKR